METRWRENNRQQKHVHHLKLVCLIPGLLLAGGCPAMPNVVKREIPGQQPETAGGETYMRLEASSNFDALQVHEDAKKGKGTFAAMKKKKFRLLAVNAVLNTGGPSAPTQDEVPLMKWDTEAREGETLKGVELDKFPVRQFGQSPELTVIVRAIPNSFQAVFQDVFKTVSGVLERIPLAQAAIQSHPASAAVFEVFTAVSEEATMGAKKPWYNTTKIGLLGSEGLEDLARDRVFFFRREQDPQAPKAKDIEVCSSADDELCKRGTQERYQELPYLLIRTRFLPYLDPTDLRANKAVISCTDLRELSKDELEERYFEVPEKYLTSSQARLEKALRGRAFTLNELAQLLSSKHNGDVNMVAVLESAASYASYEPPCHEDDKQCQGAWDGYYSKEWEILGDSCFRQIAKGSSDPIKVTEVKRAAETVSEFTRWRDDNSSTMVADLKLEELKKLTTLLYKIDFPAKAFEGQPGAEAVTAVLQARRGTIEKQLIELSTQLEQNPTIDDYKARVGVLMSSTCGRCREILQRPGAPAREKAEDELANARADLATLLAGAEEVGTSETTIERAERVYGATAPSISVVADPKESGWFYPGKVSTKQREVNRAIERIRTEAVQEMSPVEAADERAPD